MRQSVAPDTKTLSRFLPVPHPSWFAADQHRERRLSAEEFWSRLGL